jgi:hypothetical protein
VFGKHAPGLPGPFWQQPEGQLCASQMHCPRPVQRWPVGHVPQVPPQPSGPQVLPVQSGSQMHWPLRQRSCSAQTWQGAPPLPQALGEVPGSQLLS